MSGLVARILLAMLMLPAAGAVALLIFAQVDPFNSHSTSCAITGCATYLFTVIYWTLLWRRTVKWTPTRLIWTFLFVVICALGGVATSYLLRESYNDYITDWTAPLITPLAWLILTTFLWRETAEERAERLRSLNKDGVTCPACGYNLTGLQSTRCPECGKLYTLDELLASQPSRADAEVKD